jgi:hypothetical protein
VHGAGLEQFDDLLNERIPLQDIVPLAGRNRRRIRWARAVVRLRNRALEHDRYRSSEQV